MKYLIGIFLLTFSCVAQLDISSPFFVAGVLKPASAGGGVISDDFNRADNNSPGANWTEISASDVDILSNEANAPQTFDFAFRAIIYNASSTATINQYIKVAFTANNGASQPGVILRFTDTSSEFYSLRFDDVNDLIRWYRLADENDGSGTEIGSGAAMTISFPLTVGVTIDGTGNDTVIRIWESPTADAPTSATSWDGGAADDTLTDDPANPVDSGTKVGLGGIGSLGALAWDNFFAWDIP